METPAKLFFNFKGQVGVEALLILCKILQESNNVDYNAS
jgi:hypothetical protein